MVNISETLREVKLDWFIWMGHKYQDRRLERFTQIYVVEKGDLLEIREPVSRNLVCTLRKQ